MKRKGKKKRVRTEKREGKSRTTSGKELKGTRHSIEWLYEKNEKKEEKEKRKKRKRKPH